MEPDVDSYPHSNWQSSGESSGTQLELDVGGGSLTVSSSSPPSTDELVNRCYSYLSSLPYTTWAGYMISNEDRRLKAAEWFAKEARCLAVHISSSQVAEIVYRL